MSSSTHFISSSKMNTVIFDLDNTLLASREIDLFVSDQVGSCQFNPNDIYDLLFNCSEDTFSNT